MTERPEIPLAVFQQLRDRPQFNTENWLGRRILRHYGLVPSIRRKIRNELMKDTPYEQRNEWQIARLVVDRVRQLQGILTPYPELAALRENDYIRAVDWYRDIILPGRGAVHLLARTIDDRALAVWWCFSNKLLADVSPPYLVEACKSPGVVLIVHSLDSYLGPAELREALLINMFGCSPAGVSDSAPDEDEDPDYE
jgi:hypothetical protein